MDYLRWDPSGRFLVDAIQQPMGNSYYKYSYDNGALINIFKYIYIYIHLYVCYAITVVPFATYAAFPTYPPTTTTTTTTNTHTKKTSPTRLPLLDLPGPAAHPLPPQKTQPIPNPPPNHRHQIFQLKINAKRSPQPNTPGFRFWTFQGQLVAHVEKTQFYQFAWRPRPPPLLSAEQQRKIKKGKCVPFM